MPVRIDSNWCLESLPTSSVSNSRSRVMIWEALATESFGRPVARAGRSTLPGASAQRRLLVKERIPRFGSGSGSAHLLGLLEPACESRDRNCWIWKVCPIHVALGDYHSTSSRVRLAAASTAGSGYVSTASRTRFIASVTVSGS